MPTTIISGMCWCAQLATNAVASWKSKLPSVTQRTAKRWSVLP
jgi:hypothetical protein